MGARGPAAKPTALKKREGTYRPDRAPKREAQPQEGVGPMPANVSRDKYAKEAWEQLAPLLLKLRLMTVADWVDFAGLCKAYSNACHLDDHVAKNGHMVSTPWGDKLNPAVSGARLAWAEVRQFAAKFGLSPSDRTRVSAGEPTDEKDNAEAFIFGGPGKVVGAIGAS